MNSVESKGIIMFNRGNKCIIRAMVCLDSLREHYDGPVTFYLEEPYPKEFEKVCKHYNVDIIRNDTDEKKVLVRKTEMFGNPPYDRTLWLDADMLVLGKLDEMFDALDDCDCAIPHFCGWWSDGPKMSARIKKFKDIVEDRYYEESFNHHPATNTGILSFKKSDRWMDFVEDWVELANEGAKAKIFIPDEVAFQILYPMAIDWGLRIKVVDRKFNVSVLHDHGETDDKRVMHYHGQKHVLDVETCDLWKEKFNKMCENNTANINSFLQYADKRLKIYLKKRDGEYVDTTIVTACDQYYVDILRLTFANWRKYKGIDKYPVIVFVNGIDLKDERLDFLRLPNVRMIEWSLLSADSHREEMLSAFVFGAADHVKTDYWLKLDADSYATDDRPFITDKMKNYAFCGHKWGYSRPDHIKALDKWAKGHWKRKLRRAKPMIEEGRIEGRRFYHNTKRTISFIQLHKLKFTKFCVKLLKERKLPAPTQDTYMFFVANRFDPETVGVMNFKRRYGFTQGRGKLGSEHIAEKLAEVEKKNESNN